MGIKGITVALTVKTLSGTDEFNRPTYSESTVNVDNVLVAPVSSQEIINDLDLNGAKEVYQLAIPKGDTHDWHDTKVSFFSQSYKTVGLPIQGIESMIPLKWNKKVTVARYE